MRDGKAWPILRLDPFSARPLPLIVPMSSMFHRLGRCLAALLVALLIGATALPPALHADMDDLACEFGAARSARATHVEDNDTQDSSLHCEVCHWLRSIRVFETAPAAASAVAEAVAAVAPPPAVALATAVVTARSSRAPPRS